MRYNKFAALISAASMAVMSAMPVMQANAEAPDLSDFLAEPVFEYFNDADVNGAIGVLLPDTVSAHVEITFDSPEGLNFPYYVKDMKAGGGTLFQIEGYSNTEDDYRNYHISIEMYGGIFDIAAEPFIADFTVPDGNDDPDSFTAIAYNFLLDDEVGESEIEYIDSEFNEDSIKDKKVISEKKNYKLHLNGYLKGDINRDGIVDGTDATLVLNEFGTVMGDGESTFNGRQFAAGDIDGSGAIDGSDATLILKYFGMASAEQEPDWDDIIPKD